MLRSLISTASHYLNKLNLSLWPNGQPDLHSEPATVHPTPTRTYGRLQKVLLTDEVNRTILHEFAAHRESFRGEEEIGWMLLGTRELHDATILATLPAGARRDAGVAHVRFNSDGQALASRIVRQWDRQLTILGVLHTHPGSLRHPSGGDYRGDSQWVGRLRGKEGIFGIGTADADSANGRKTMVAYNPQAHRQCLGELCFSWYTLGEGDQKYRPVDIGLTIGPDLALPLRPVWQTIENYADQLDRLCRQQSAVRFDITSDLDEPALAVILNLAGGDRLRVLINDHAVRYYLMRDEELIEVDPKEGKIDRAIYLILAELAG